MTRNGANVLLNCSLILAVNIVGRTCVAQTLDQQAGSASSTTTIAADDSKPQKPNTTGGEKQDSGLPAPGYSNSLGVEFLKHLISDQKSIWTSPAHLRWADGAWLFPLAAVTAGFLATDRSVPPALTSDQTKLNRYVSISNYGLYSMVGATGGLYIWSKLSHDDHQRETGLLAGEAAIDSLAVATALKYAFGRERPYVDHGLGNFFQGGDSFPSDHSLIAWSIASVIAHEYPGPLTQVGVYGLATLVSATRVMGQQHFPSDVVVGAAVGWLIGREVYRAHHDPDLGGDVLKSLSGFDGGDEDRDRKHMGSPSVALDSWVYSAFERLAALGYIDMQIMGIKPWTRMECGRLTEEAGEFAQREPTANNEEGVRIQAQLAQEFAYETALLGGGHNLTANVESVYARAVSISGPALTDSDHFGQTISYDFGRPFERGTNGQAGGSFSAAAGPLTIYVRAEYQHAPSAPALSSTALSAVATADLEPPSAVPSGPIMPTNRVQLLDSYVGVNLGNLQLTLGPQSLSWTSAPDGSMIWSDNIAPVNMVRIVNPEPLRLPSFLRYLGPVRIDHFFGRLEGHPYVPRPFVYGQKINMKPVSFLELGFARTVMIGGQGVDDGNQFTTGYFLDSFFGRQVFGTVPGHTSTEMDWTLYVPKIRNYVVLYGDAYATDDQLPIKDPPKNPWRPGIYITRFPKLPKLDLHVDSVSTEQPGFSFDSFYTGGPANKGQFNYWNQSYHDGYTNGGFIIGNSVGRDGRAFQGWLTYWLSPSNNLQVFFKNSSVAGEFMPGGGAWQDYAVRAEMHLRSRVYVKTELQYEHISRYPVLFNGPQNNITAILEVGFSPKEREKK
jgi:membrane-associated phospholipid phosphatase